MSKFKQGDIVYDLAMGWTKVINDEYCSEYPIRVENKRTFIADGRYNNNEKLQTLLTVEEAAKMNIFLPKKKVQHTVKCFCNVLDDDSVWTYYSEGSAARVAKHNCNTFKFKHIAVPCEVKYEVEE